jgi:transcriptional regulator with XRE-family HTH domain
MLYETFRSKLRRMRPARGLTTKRLAELAGVTPSYLTQIQKGNREPPDDLAVRLARVLALESPEASELRRVLKKERILRAINKSGAETVAARRAWTASH